MVRRGLTDDECTKDVLESAAFKGATADCLRQVILYPTSVSEGGISISKAELPQTISLKNGHVELLGIEERVKNLWRTEVASGNGARWKAGIVRDSAGLIIDAESTGGFMETTEDATEWEQEGDGYTRMCRWVVIDHTGAEFA